MLVLLRMSVLVRVSVPKTDSPPPLQVEPVQWLPCTRLPVKVASDAASAPPPAPMLVLLRMSVLVRVSGPEMYSPPPRQSVLTQWLFWNRPPVNAAAPAAYAPPPSPKPELLLNWVPFTVRLV